MKKQRKALKNLTIILLSIFIVLFFVFILTFDLTDKSKYENTKTKEETSTYLVDYLNDALTKSSILNILDIDFDDDFQIELANEGLINKIFERFSYNWVKRL